MTAPTPEGPRQSRAALVARRLLTGRTGALAALLVLVVGLVVLRVAGGGPEAGGPTGSSTSPSPSSGPSPSVSPTALPSPSPSVSVSVSAILPTPPSVTATTCVPQSRSARLRVVTYNIKSGRFGGYTRLPAIIDELKSVHPDVVLLEEVDKNRPISGRLDEPSILGEGLGYEFTFGLNVLRPGDSEYGTAILSRHKILASNNVHLPNRPGLQQRGLLGVSIRVKGIPLNIYVTHLSNESATMRYSQIQTVSAILAKDPVINILGGDLNSTPGTAVMQYAYRSLSDTWDSVGVGPGHTEPAGSPRARIDYLLYQQGDDPATTLTPISAEVLGVGSSDHRAVLARYRLDQTASPVCVPTG